MDVSGHTFRQRLLLLVGSIGPLGHLPASGTVTVALVGVPVFYLLHLVQWPQWWLLAFTLPFTFAAVWLHDAGDRLLQEKDSRKLVVDELVGFFIAIWYVPFTWQIAALAFLLERGIDIAKVPPARQVERSWPGGWGVVGDDVIAGLYTCLLLHLFIWLFPPLAQPLFAG